MAYGSRTLSRTEKNYCVTDRELLAVRYFMEYYRQYLLGRKFLVRTDHQALRWLFSLRNPKDRVARWLETLSAFEFSIEYRPGKKHSNADGMSRRCPRPHECRCPLLQDDEVLKCGPCNKCKRKADLMDSSLMTAEGKFSPDYQSPVRQDDERVIRAVRVCTSGKTIKLTILVKRVGVPERINGEMQLFLMMRQRLGRTGRARRCNRIRAVKHSYNLRERRDGTENSRGSDNSPLVTQHRYWALPKMSELRDKQLKDPDIAPVIKWKEDGRRPSGKAISSQSPATRHYWLYYDALFLTEGVLFRRFIKRDGIGCHVQFVVPRTMKDAIMYQVHNALPGGHLGRLRTAERLLRRFYWFEVRKDCDLWIERCDKCASIKKPPKTARAPMGEMLVGALLIELVWISLACFQKLLGSTNSSLLYQMDSLSG